MSRGDVVLDGYEDGYAYGWFTVFEGPHVATFYTEVLKLFAPYQRGALNVAIADETDETINFRNDTGGLDRHP